MLRHEVRASAVKKGLELFRKYDSGVSKKMLRNQNPERLNLRKIQETDRLIFAVLPITEQQKKAALEISRERIKLTKLHGIVATGGTVALSELRKLTVTAIKGLRSVPDPRKYGMDLTPSIQYLEKQRAAMSGKEGEVYVSQKLAYELQQAVQLQLYFAIGKDAMGEYQAIFEAIVRARMQERTNQGGIN